MSLNTCVLLGRITAPLELKSTQSGMSVLQFTVAVDRDYTKQGEERQADFISCVAWKQTAEFISRYFGKGRMIALTGRLQSRTYDDRNGSKHYVTELIVNTASFTGEPTQDGGNYQQGGGYQQGNNQQPAGDLEGFDADIISDGGVPF